MDLIKQRDEAAYARLLGEAQSVRGVSLARDAWRRLRRRPVAMVSLGFLILLAVLTFFTPLLPLQPPRRQNPLESLHPPQTSPLWQTVDWLDQDGNLIPDEVSSGFGIRPENRFKYALVQLRAMIFGNRELNSICGRDTLGRDLLSRLFWGARVSLLVGIVAALVSLVIGVSYGATSGYIGGRVDNLMMRIVDVLYSVPFIFVVIFLISILSDEKIKSVLNEWHIDRIAIFYLVVGAIYWLTMARVVRGQVLSLKQEQFIEAARTTGASRFRIIFRHLIPNLVSVVIVYLTLTIPRVMLFEAFLSFLGLGVEPPDVSWGLLADEGVRAISKVQFDWWMVVFPGLALGLTLFSLNFLGDGLRDALDPRMKNR